MRLREEFRKLAAERWEERCAREGREVWPKFYGFGAPGPGGRVAARSGVPIGRREQID